MTEELWVKNRAKMHEVVHWLDQAWRPSAPTRHRTWEIPTNGSASSGTLIARIKKDDIKELSGLWDANAPRSLPPDLAACRPNRPTKNDGRYSSASTFQSA